MNLLNQGKIKLLDLKNIYTALFITTLTNSACITQKATRHKQASRVETANKLAKDGLLKEALYAYKRVISKEPRNLTAHKNLGIVYVKTGDYGNAIKHLTKALAKYANSFEINFYLGEAFRAKEKFGKAIFRYNRSLEYRPTSKKALKALAWSYYKVRFYSEAISTSWKLHKLSPNDTQVTIIQARTYLKVGRYRKALRVISKSKAITKKNDLPYLISVEGDIFLKIGKIKKAEKLYREALKDQPLLAGALLGLAKTLLKNNQNSALAIKYLERSVRIKPRLKESLYLLGKLSEKTSPQKASRYYKQFKKYAATDPEFQSQLQEARKFSASKSKKVREQQL